MRVEYICFRNIDNKNLPWHFGNPYNPSTHFSHLMPKMFDLQEHCPFPLSHLVSLDPSGLQSQTVKIKQYNFLLKNESEIYLFHKY